MVALMVKKGDHCTKIFLTVRCGGDQDQRGINHGRTDCKVHYSLIITLNAECEGNYT